MKTKKVPPSKIRYDACHPIISIRVDIELKKDLDKLRADTGKNLADILREAVEFQRSATVPGKPRPVTKPKHVVTVFEIKKPSFSNPDTTKPEQPVPQDETKSLSSGSPSTAIDTIHPSKLNTATDQKASEPLPEAPQ